MSWTITGSEKTPVDPVFQDVSLLLHGNGTNGSTAFTDNSPSPKAATFAGNAQISTTQSKFGGASINPGGDGGSIYFPAGSDFVYRTGNFTVEAWVYITSLHGLTSQGSVIFSQTTSGTNYFLFAVDQFGTPNFTSTLSGTGTIINGPTSAVTTSNWHHVAVVRNSGEVKVYANGNGGTGVSNTVNLTNTTYAPTVGGYSHNNSAGRFIGFIDELRITKGIARYTANFTPPTAPFPDI